MVTAPEQELDGELVEMGTELTPEEDLEIGPQLELGLVENATRKKKHFFKK